MHSATIRIKSNKDNNDIKMNLKWAGMAWTAFTPFTIWTTGMLL